METVARLLRGKSATERTLAEGTCVMSAFSSANDPAVRLRITVAVHSLALLSSHLFFDAAAAARCDADAAARERVGALGRRQRVVRVFARSASASADDDEDERALWRLIGRRRVMTDLLGADVHRDDPVAVAALQEDDARRPARRFRLPIKQHVLLSKRE